MTPATRFRTLIAVACAALVTASVGWRSARSLPGLANASPSGLAAARLVVQATDSDVIDSLATAISDHDPFRLTHEPSSVAYAAELEGVPPPPPPPKPPIAVSGIIGPPWAAVVEGVPGHEGSLLATVGDTLSRPPFALAVLRRITRDTVVVHTADTTWKLTVRPAWR